MTTKPCCVDGCARPRANGRIWCLRHLGHVQAGSAVEFLDVNPSCLTRAAAVGGPLRDFNPHPLRRRLP